MQVYPGAMTQGKMIELIQEEFKWKWSSHIHYMNEYMDPQQKEKKGF